MNKLTGNESRTKPGGTPVLIFRNYDFSQSIITHHLQLTRYVLNHSKHNLNKSEQKENT